MPTLTDEQAARLIGMPIRSLKANAGKGGLPRPLGHDSWDAAAVERYVDMLAGTPVDGAWFEHGPYATKEACRNLLNRMHRLDVRGRVMLYPDSGKYVVAVPCGALPSAKVAEDLKELFPSIPFKFVPGNAWLRLDVATS